jgi:MYXO-CTERM domain-containing protein
MFGHTFHRTLLASSLAFLAAAAAPRAVHAQIMEPPDTVHPSGFGPIPVDPRTLCLRTDTKVGGSIGCTGTTDTGDYQQWGGNANTLDNMSLIGLFKIDEVDASNNILVDFQKDAHTTPATFNPLCSIQGKMVLHGGGCLVDFGWYCADGTPNPTIYPLVTSDQVLAYGSVANPPYPKVWQSQPPDGSFLPKVGYEIAGTPLSNIAGDANFKLCSTKKIGFAIQGNSTKNCTIGAAACACTQNKYTEQNLNQVSSASNKPYVDAVVYASKKYPGRFYVAIEDLPTSTAQFDAPYVHLQSGTSVTWNADGDFNDFVYTVEGVVCQGGGQLCTVPGQQGICATGVTSCVDPSSTAAPTCDPVFKAQTEVCNAIDDDCNGTIDDGPGLCPQGQTCIKGSCVGSCATGEFTCPTGQICTGPAPGYCIDAACATLDCAADQKCVGGQCVGGCTGVICTAGQQCVAGICVDLCDARTKAGLPACPDNFVCQNGACVPNCTCLPCPDPTQQECQSTSTLPGFGRCVASGCSDGHCGTQLCVPGGNCIDPCGSNPCASGQKCTAAKQFDPNSDVNHQYSCTNPDGTVVGTGGSANVVLGNQAGSGNNGAAAGPGVHGPGNSTASLGCGCRTLDSRTQGLGLAALLGLSVLAMRRRRRN